jgi:transposase
MVMLGVSGDFIPEETKVSDGRSRPGFQIDSFTRSFLAKNFFRIDSNDSLRLRLQSKGNLKRRCGFTTVPSAATFSRRMKELSKNATMERVLNGLVKE